MNEYGFIRIGACVPELKVGDVEYNADEIIKNIKYADEKKAKILTFPELCLTGYTCGDLFFQDIVEYETINNLNKILNETKSNNIISIIGLPLKVDNKLYNCAVVISQGKILGIVPKTYIPNYNEFYEKRWFESSNNLNTKKITILNQEVNIGTNILFQDIKNREICFGIEICEDVWSVNPTSNDHVLNGATIMFNLSASNEIIGKSDYRRKLISLQSSKNICGYVYASSGVNESTTDLLFSGHSMIVENGNILSENKRFDFNSNMIINDIDVKRLMNDRCKNTSFVNYKNNVEYKKIPLSIGYNKTTIRKYSKYPFVPKNDKKRDERCEEILNIQAYSLAKRLKHTNISKCVIGISGGLDSTLAFLVIVRAFKILGIDNKNIIGVTMPGFGTTDRTYENAVNFVNNYGATLKEINIRDVCIKHFEDIGHDINKRDVTYENAQARERTQILMDIANKEDALVIGTGDLSELALGWCTYNGDHMSMYAVNTSIPKTLVKYIVKYEADTTDNENNKKTIYDILNTPISPELLPPDEYGKIKQKTEDKIGPYVLHDFFLYHFLRYGATPDKIFYIACNTFKEDFTKEEIKKWLTVFINRFFSQQFKRSCMPDGVKVGTISLSPRGDFRMPSDASKNIWIKRLNKMIDK